MKRSFIREILDAINKETISFAGGLPCEELFPMKELQEAGAEALSVPSNLQYMSGSGLPALKRKIADNYCREGFSTDVSNILITSGSQQGLYIIARHFAGRDIVIEEPSYLGAVNAFAMNGLQMHTAPLSHNGINQKIFHSRFSDAKLAYLIPDFQNPRGSFYSKENRRQTADITDGYIIEDSPYTELYFEEKGISISSLIPDKAIQLGSFSKTFAPGLRIGWIRGPEEIIRQLTVIKETMDLHSCSISQHILNAYLDRFDLLSQLMKLRGAYREKMEIFAEALAEHLPEFQFERPRGGMFIYGRLPDTDTYELVWKCMKRNIVYVPGSEFYTDGRKTDEIRFNYTHADRQQTVAGLEIIRQEAGL